MSRERRFDVLIIRLFADLMRSGLLLRIVSRFSFVSALDVFSHLVELEKETVEL